MFINAKCIRTPEEPLQSARLEQYWQTREAQRYRLTLVFSDTANLIVEGLTLEDVTKIREACGMPVLRST